MKFAELVSAVEEFSRKGSDTLIIMPFYLEYGWLSDHLGALSKQTFQDFDVILILNKVSDETKVYEIIRKGKPRFGIIVAKRKEDTGSAGGFFTGQRYALENGYKQMIIVDIDCIPIDNDLVEMLVRNKDRGYVKPTVRITDAGRVVQTMAGGVIPWYSLISMDTARKYGLYYLPLYYGAEDLDYASRIKEKPFVIGSKCQHPAPSIQSYKNLDKSLIYMVNGLAVIRDLRALPIYVVTLIVSMPAYLVFFPAYGSKAFNALLSCLLTHTYGKRASERLVSGFGGHVQGKAPDGFEHVDYSSSLSLDKQYFLMPLRIMKDTFRRNIVIDHSKSGFLATFVPIFAKKSYYWIENRGHLLLSDNSNPVLHAVKLLLFAALLPIIAVFIIFYVVPMNLILRPKTDNYGLD
ncbi:MAG: glycosyltransferase [Candidatus Micrarchaeota archaeon]